MANILPTTKQILNDNFNALNNSLIKKTVGYQSGMDYYIATGATNADVAINAAIAAVSAAGGGTVELGYGTFTISNPILMRDNVHLKGQGCGQSYWDYSLGEPATFVTPVTPPTTIKAKDGYAPTTLNVLNGYSMLLNYNDVDSSSYTYNIEVSGITWNANAQNWGDARIINDVGVSGAPHRAIWPRQTTGLKFHDNEVMNPWNWTCYFHLGRQWHIYRNRILSGWDSNDTNKYVNGRQDGIDVKGRYIWVYDNYIDTYGLQVAGTQGSGDDAIGVRGDSAGDGASQYVWVKNNFILGGSRGIFISLAGDSDSDMTNIFVEDNDIFKASGAGILINRPSTSINILKNIKVNNNVIRQSGLGGSVGAGNGINLTTTGTASFGFKDIDISGNTIEQSNVTGAGGADGWGITFLGAGSNIKITRNNIASIAGVDGITVNTGTYSVIGAIISDNDVNMVSANSIGIRVDGLQQAVISNNIVRCDTNTGTAIRIRGVGTSSVNSLYNTVGNNIIKGFTNGIVENNSGMAPNYNVISGNIFTGVSTKVTLTGANSLASVAAGTSLNVTD